MNDLATQIERLEEKAIALKAGRQKKIQIIDGQQVEVLGEEEDEMEEYEDEDILLDESALEGEQGTAGNVIAVQTSDGQQQYIVLEITQLNEGEEAVQQESKVQQVLQSSSSTSGRKFNFETRCDHVRLCRRIKAKLLTNSHLKCIL